MINDARADMYDPKMVEQDLERYNSDFAYCTVDGVMYTFLVTLKEIKRGEQLFAFYGASW